MKHAIWDSINWILWIMYHIWCKKRGLLIYYNVHMVYNILGIVDSRIHVTYILCMMYDTYCSIYYTGYITCDRVSMMHCLLYVTCYAFHVTCSTYYIFYITRATLYIICYMVSVIYYIVCTIHGVLHITC